MGTSAHRFSAIGRKLASRSGILELMDDLGTAMTTRPDLLMLGGGNPAAVPLLRDFWREKMHELLLSNEADFDRMLLNYDPPRGNPEFIDAVVQLFHDQLGWDIGPEHVAVTTGAQSAVFCLFNILAGHRRNGDPGKILLPIVPEYIGYADVGLDEELFVACKPIVEITSADHNRPRFRYHIDPDAVRSALHRGNVGAIALSRPSNPSSNVLSDKEITLLDELATQYDIPLVIDNAYGNPFPGIIFRPATTTWSPNRIHTFSLSKLGLPGTRTGIVIGPPEIIGLVQSMTAIIGLANGNIGQRLIAPLFRSGEILQLGDLALRRFYQERSLMTQQILSDAFAGSGIPWALHESDGAFFLWLWLRDLPITTLELYAKLREKGVLVVPGEYFFYGLDETSSEITQWNHRHECLRISFTQPPEIVERGIRMIVRTLQEPD
ncbi:MAG: valine--pyruvate transaminase [Planctomycetia bacterium]|nr:valine--pyruvate transaminase [Planctomycetia bacterium]